MLEVEMTKSWAHRLYANQRCAEQLAKSDPVRFQHSTRFRRVADKYPRRVWEAYGGDIAMAAGDSDEHVAATVREWEIANGLEPRDWVAWGRDQEGRE
jgi:hypothetical protein